MTSMTIRQKTRQPMQHSVDMAPVFRAAWQHVGTGVLKHQRCGCYSEENLVGRKWYCIMTHPGADLLANAMLRRQGFVVFLPLFVNRTRYDQPTIEPLFSGYQFVAADRQRESLAAVQYTRGVNRFVAASPNAPTPVRAGLVEALIERSGDDGLIDESKRQTADAPIAPGAMVRILNGPLAGTEGICEMSTHDRVRVLMNLLGSSTVTVQRRDVEAVA